VAQGEGLKFKPQYHQKKKKRKKEKEVSAGLTPINLATQEAEITRITV
jgi:hypothetical protein